MSKVVEIVNGRVHREYPRFKTSEEAYTVFARNLLFVDAPNNVHVGFGFDPDRQGDNRFIRPLLSEGWEYDENNHPWNPEAQRKAERVSFHAMSTNDTMQALRKIREGDTTIDWSAWLDALDAFNIAVEETKNQPDYPYIVDYPEYPQKPIS